MSMFAQLLANAFDRRQPLTNPQPDDRPISHLITDLVGTRGEISGRALGQEILNRYDRYEDTQKRDFFDYLACEMDVDAEKVRQGLVDLPGFSGERLTHFASAALEYDWAFVAER